MVDEKQEKLDNLVKELIILGEDEKELKFWQEIFDDLKDDEKEKLLLNFQEELSKLNDLRRN